MGTETDKDNQSDSQMAKLEAQLQEIRASRQRMHEELIQKSFEPVRSRARAWAPAAIVLSSVVVGLAVYGLLSFVEGEEGVPSGPDYMSAAPLAAANTAPAVKEPPAAGSPVDGEEEPPKGAALKATPPPAEVAQEEPRSARRPSPAKPRGEQPPKDILDKVLDCGDDPMCGGMD